MCLTLWKQLKLKNMKIELNTPAASLCQLAELVKFFPREFYAIVLSIKENAPESDVVAAGFDKSDAQPFVELSNGITFHCYSVGYCRVNYMALDGSKRKYFSSYSEALKFVSNK